MGIFDHLREPSSPRGQADPAIDDSTSSPLPGAAATVDDAELHVRLNRALNEVARLRTEVEEAGSRARVATEEEFAARLAVPLTQLAAQAYLVREAAGTVRTSDLAATIRRLIREADVVGMSLVERPGEEVRFDPDRHSALATAVAPGEPVTVRIPGLRAPSGRIVQTARVESV